MEKIKILELFGGIGSARKALINLGIPHKLIDYVEIDEKACSSYNAMFPAKHDMQTVVNYNLKPDILIHGSPCQDFSRSGKRLGGKDEDKTRSSLMWETIKIIESLGVWKPKFVVWENVKGVLDKDMINVFNKYILSMKELGYSNNFKVLDARDFGIPQKRERVFTISILGNKIFNFDNLEKRKMRNILEFLEISPGEKYTIKSPSMLSKINCKHTRALTTIKTHSLTITTKQNRCPNSGIIDIGNNQYRLLTEKECWKLMGFDDEDFSKALKEHPSREGCQNGVLYKQAGNSIIVPILESIFKELLKIK
ncbi:MAG: DNA cytosine methyltransferase [Fusobacteriaceae bacterium]